MWLIPSLLLGVLAAAIPLLIHLLHRQKTTPVPWGAMMFLEESELQQRHRRKVDNWLLMLLRMGVLAFLAFMLARPVLLQTQAAPLVGQANSDVAVVIDHSLSTGRRSGPATLFEQSVAAVDRLAESLRPGDTLSVVLAEHQPRRLTATPALGTGEIRAAVEQLHKLPPGLTDTSIPQALRTAQEMVKRGRNLNKIILILSDEQRFGWQIDDESSWQNALGQSKGKTDTKPAIYAAPLPLSRPQTDVAVTDLDLRPAVVGMNRPLRVTATLHNSGPDSLTGLPVQLRVDAAVAGTQTIAELGPNQSRSVRFDTTLTTAGSHSIAVRVEATDGLEADNTKMAALEVLDRLAVLVIDGDLSATGAFQSSQFLRSAMQPVEELQEKTTLIQPRVISAADSLNEDLENYAAVVVNDVQRLPAGVMERLGQYVRGGHGLWLILGPRTSPNLVAEQLKSAGLAGWSLQPAWKTDTPPSVVLTDPTHPTVALLADPQRNALAGLVTMQWWPVKADPQTRTIAATTDGQPLMLERPVGDHGGRVVLWSSSVDAQWNNWPLSANSFVPLVQETLFHLAGGAGAGKERTIEAGQPLVWSRRATTQPALGSVELVTPDGRTVAPDVVRLAGREIVTWSDTAAPGLYRLHFASPATTSPSATLGDAHYAVGLDPRELDPQTLSATDLNWLKEHGFIRGRLDAGQLASVLAGSNGGGELWPLFALAVLAMLLWETFITYRFIRLQATPIRW